MCGPSFCPIADKINLKIDFTPERTLNNAVWDLKYIVDSAFDRHIINLGTSSKETYTGPSTFTHIIPYVDVSGIKPSSLSNIGLLVLTLIENDTEIIDIKIVVQVKKEDGLFIREFLNPLEYCFT